MQDDAARSGSAMEMIKSIWDRRKWLALIVFLVPFVGAVAVIMFLPTLHRSTATILVDRQQVPESMVRPTVTSALETRLHTINQEILSRSRLEILINQFNLYADLRRRAPLEQAIERMRRDIRLEAKSIEQKEDRKGATIAFTLSYEGRDPQTVARVTNTLASAFIEENLKARERQAAGTASFLKAQLGEVKKRLDEQEVLVSRFKKRHMGELPQQTDANLNTIERLITQVRFNGDQQTRVQERRESLAKQFTDAASLEPGATGPEANAQRLARLNQDLRTLRGSYSDLYPDIVRLKAEITALEREMAEPREKENEKKSATPVLSPQLMRVKQAQADADGELNALRSEEKRLRAALATYIGRVENAPQREQELRELSRDYEATQNHYASLLRRHEEAQLAENMEQRQKGEQFRVIEPAVASAEGTAPNRLRLFLVALGACAALALGAVLVAEQINASFHSVDDLRALTTVPVLLSIPLIVTPEDTARRTRRMRLATAAVMVTMLLLVGVSYYVAHDNEQLVTLVTRTKA
jgi:polysaccharide chain length determinant protein (PEP-CTERM system associated)